MAKLACGHRRRCPVIIMIRDYTTVHVDRVAIFGYVIIYYSIRERERESVPTAYKMYVNILDYH